MEVSMFIEEEASEESESDGIDDKARGNLDILNEVEA